LPIYHTKSATYQNTLLSSAGNPAAEFEPITAGDAGPATVRDDLAYTHSGGKEALGSWCQ
jgi:hypothetical protein